MARTTPASADDTPVDEHAFVEVRNGPAVTHVALGQSHLLIGRAPDTQIHLDHPSVSRHHAELYRDPFARWWVRDLSSRNGTLVNGRRVTEQILSAGDLVQVGTCTIKLPAAAPASRTVFIPPARSNVMVTEGEGSTISTLREIEPPRIAASHLMTLSTFSQHLLTTADQEERHDALCRLMTGEEFHAQSAVVMRIAKQRPDDPPRLMCEPRGRGAGAGLLAGDGAAAAPYVSRSLLRAVRSTGEAALANNLYTGTGASPAIEISISPSIMAVAAVACPLHEDADDLDLLYAVLPPQYGTGEWLALASLAARQFQQAEQVWQARARSEAHAALERELERARQIQMALVPRDAKVAGLDLAIGFAPCRWVGGDYVDVVAMPDGRTLLVVADVCGKGLAAALVSSGLHTMVHSHLEAGADVGKLMRQLNTYLAGTMRSESFVTMIAVAFDPASGHAECVNAGHPPPFIVTPGGELRQVRGESNMPLACDMDNPLEPQSFELSAGELLVLYSDGLTEQRDEARQMLGVAGLGGWLREACVPGVSAGAVADNLNQRLGTLRGERMADDDCTFLIARRIAS